MVKGQKIELRYKWVIFRVAGCDSQLITRISTREPSYSQSISLIRMFGIKCNTSQFADDMKPGERASCEEDVKTLQGDVERLN